MIFLLLWRSVLSNLVLAKTRFSRLTLEKSFMAFRASFAKTFIPPEDVDLVIFLEPISNEAN